MAIDMLSAAADARTAVNELLTSLDRAADDLGYDYVAELLDIDERTLRARLDGSEDMTLSQLRQLAIATSMSVHIETAPSELVNA